MRTCSILACVLWIAACASQSAAPGRDAVSAAPAAERQEAAGAAAVGLVPTDLAMCFVDPERPATLRWRAAQPAAHGSTAVVIRDYAGTRIGADLARVEADGSVVLTRTFARGWYEIEFPQAQQSFGVVALEAHTGERDPYFCMDAALSWLETDPERRDGLVRILARCGIGMVRERLGLGSINVVPETYVWEHAKRRYDSLRALYATHGIQLLEMLEGGGKHHELTRIGRFPTVFHELARSHAAQEERWGRVWGAVEIQNEPDITGAPAEQYVGVVKASSWAHARTGSAVPLVAGAFAGMPPGPYFEASAANGMLADCDAISFHSYDRADAVEAMVARYRVWLAASAREALPLWHSECGWPWVKGPARAARDQDIDSAAEIAFKGIEGMACGVARHFAFVYVYYGEGPKNFGMMGREGTPLRSMAAYAASVAHLSGMRYVGDLHGVEGPAKLARVFARDGGTQRLVALYAGRPQVGLRVRLPVPVLRAAGADGRALALDDGAVPLDDGMAYAWVEAAAVAQHVRTDAPAVRLADLGRQPLRQQRLASPVVLQFLAQHTPARASSRRYLLSQETARALPVRVRIQNLSEAAVVMRPALTLPGGQVAAAEPVEVPARGMAECGWTVDASTVLDIAATRLLTVTAAADGIAQPSPLAIPMVMEGTLEQHLAKHRHQRPLPITDLSLWRANHAGHGRSSMVVEDGIWRLADVFDAAGGSWNYPRFAMPQPIDPVRESGFVLRARIASAARNVAIMADPNTPGAFWCTDLFPPDGAWHTVYVPFAELVPGPLGAGMQNTRQDPASWRMLALGMGGHRENTFEISHLLVVGGGG